MAAHTHCAHVHAIIICLPRLYNLAHVFKVGDTVLYVLVG